MVAVSITNVAIASFIGRVGRGGIIVQYALVRYAPRLASTSVQQRNTV